MVRQVLIFRFVHFACKIIDHALDAEREKNSADNRYNVKVSAAVRPYQASGGANTRSGDQPDDCSAIAIGVML